jgi:ribose transport system ATP-binding protein
VNLGSLAASGLTKSYGGVLVLAGVDFDVRGGEVHALVGENGAGKSTLIKILGGAVRPDAGRVVMDGVPLPLGDPRRIRVLGVSLVYQEFTLVPELTVTENIFLGRERGWPWLAREAMAGAARQVFADLDVDVPVHARVASLSVAHQQMVEIARALASDTRALILDEPTASLSGREVERLLGVVARVKARGLGVVFISHRFEEVFAVADRVTVLRDGHRVLEAQAAVLDRSTMIRAMVGRDVSEEFPARPGAPASPASPPSPPSPTSPTSPTVTTRATAPGAVALDVRGLTAGTRCIDVSFSVRPGEIVGLAGLVGAGRTSVGLAIVGATPASGTVQVAGAAVRFRSPAQALAGGVAYLTEDRKQRGLFPLMTTSANMTMSRIGAFTRFAVLSLAREREAVTVAARDVGVRITALDQLAGTLSGGNQQKALVARYLMRHPVVLILDEPTRGIDVGARTEIYALMNRLTAQGMAILMISSDLPEVLGMSDRIVVMREGRVSGELPRGAATPDAVMALATHA